MQRGGATFSLVVSLQNNLTNILMRDVLASANAGEAKENNDAHWRCLVGQICDRSECFKRLQSVGMGSFNSKIQLFKNKHTSEWNNFLLAWLNAVGMTAGLCTVPIHREQGCLVLLRSQISKYLHQRHSVTLHSFLKTKTQPARFSRQNKKHQTEKVIKYSTHAASQLLNFTSAVLWFGWPKKY